VTCQVRRFAAYRLAVLHELLAVIGGDDDSHVIDEPHRSQLVEEPLKLVVQISDPYVLEGLIVANRLLRHLGLATIHRHQIRSRRRKGLRYGRRPK